MYKQLHTIILLFIFIAAGCGTTKDTASGSIYSFMLDGNSYQIIGYTASWGETANILLQLKNGEPVLRAIDYDRNGSLDVLVYGAVDIDEANRVYRRGIAIALRDSKVQQEKSLNEFEYEDENYIYVIETFRDEDEEYQNRFFIYHKNWNTAGGFRDIGSNGVLDRAEMGGIPLEEAQQYYEMVLEKAAEKNRLEERDDERLLIKRRAVALNLVPVTPVGKPALPAGR